MILYHQAVRLYLTSCFQVAATWSGIQERSRALNQSYYVEILSHQPTFICWCSICVPVMHLLALAIPPSQLADWDTVMRAHI